MTRAYVEAREKRRPVPMMEWLIAKDGELSYFYALRILNGRFRKGEPAIALKPVWAVKYARFILRKRFCEAETGIAKDPERCYEYFRHVMKGKKLPDEMHRTMILVGFQQPENQFVRKYFMETEGLGSVREA